MATIATLLKGQKGIITDFAEEGIPVKLLEMGCLPGNTVTLVQVAPLNDPIYINLNGTHMAIRRVLAEKINLTISKDPSN